MLRKNTFLALFVLAIVLDHPTNSNAETLQVGGEESNTNVCLAIAEAMPGDTIEIVGPATSSHCTWTTSNLTIKGVGARHAVRVETGATGWSVAAENTVIENIVLEGSRCAERSCSGIELLSGSLTLRNVSVTGSDVGVEALKAEGNTLAIERCQIFGNGSNVRVGAISGFTLLSSSIHDALGGSIVETAAADNIIRNNRFASNGERTVMGELTIVGSRRTDLAGNVLVRTHSTATAGLLQYIHSEGEPGEILASQNTFVSAATGGVEFVESIGDRAPAVRLDRNVFWGEAPRGLLENASGVERNYFGVDPVFRSGADFQLEGAYVPADWGAVAVDESAFPLSTTEEKLPANAARLAEDVPGKSRVQSASTGVSPASITLASTVAGGSSYLWTNTITLTAAAPVGGVLVLVTSSNPSVVRVLTPSVLIYAGRTTGNFALQTIMPAYTAAVTIKASANGGDATEVIKVGAVTVADITMGAAEIGSNASLNTNRVQLTGPAPVGGLVVSLSSSSAAIKAPASVTVPAGMVSMNFSLTAGEVSSKTGVTITAKHNGAVQSATLTVIPAGMKSMYISPVSTSGGQTVMVKAYLNGPAPSGGTTVNLTSSNPGVLPVPASFTIPEGASDSGILAKLGWVSRDTPITVTGVTSAGSDKVSMTVVPTQVAAIGASIKLLSKQGSAKLYVSLSGPAPTEGLAIDLTSSSPASLQVPSSLVVPAGSRTVSLTLKAGLLSVLTNVTITAKAGGAAKSTLITVAP